MTSTPQPHTVALPVCLEPEYPTFRKLIPTGLPDNFDTWLEIQERTASTHAMQGHQVRLAFVNLPYLAHERPVTDMDVSAHAMSSPYRLYAGTVEGCLFVEECTRTVNRAARANQVNPDWLTQTATTLLDTVTSAIDVQALFTVAFFEPDTHEPTRNVTVHLIRDRTELVAAGNPTELDMLTTAIVMGLTYGGIAILRSRVETTELTDRVRAWELTQTGPNPLPANATARIVPKIGDETIIYDDA